MCQVPVDQNTGSFQTKNNRKISIPYKFWMSETEISHLHYELFTKAIRMKPPPQPRGQGHKNYPLTQSSWESINKYTQWLTNTNEQNLKCRLPSEAEWEYAARAGGSKKYFWGDAYVANQANCSNCNSFWDGKGASPVASFLPNSFGLYDMHGNVWEWTQDCWHDNHDQMPQNGRPWTNGFCHKRVIRGGSWRTPFEKITVSSRTFNLVNLGSVDVC